MSCVLVVAVLLVAAGTAQAIQMPFWPQYPTRTSAILNGEWEFGYMPNVSDAVNFDISKAFFDTKLKVPASFDVVQPGINGPRGTAFYRTTFGLKPGNKGLLYFAACSFYCQVYIDGKSVGDHRAGGYQPFWMDVPASSKEKRELVVLVDNRFNATTAPTHTGGDFYHFGGITRDVILHQVPAETFIQRVETFTLSLEGDIKVNVVLGGKTKVPFVNVALSIDNGSAGFAATVRVIDGVATLNAKVPNPTLWSMSKPNLHTVRVSLNHDQDVVVARFGLRIVSVSDDARLLINGEQVKLHGFNRHTMWPDTGSALTLDQVKEDLAILKQVGANYVRGAHYPQDQRFLDLCDENGIVVWEETLGPSVKVHNLLNPYWMKYQIQAVNEMVSASINHPCVIVHGFYNEGPSDNPAACPGYNKSATAIRERVGNPPSRLVTWASDTRDKDVCLNITDVVSFNYYPAWYHKPGDLHFPKEFWHSMAVWVQDHFPKKPFTISETGAGAVYEWQNSTDPKWSQEYQSEVVKQDIEFALESDRVSGITIWQLSDIKANDKDTADAGPCVYAPHPSSLSVPWNCTFIDVSANRPGGENHKGVVDYWRRKKTVYATAKSLYHQNSDAHH